MLACTLSMHLQLCHCKAWCLALGSIYWPGSPTNRGLSKISCQMSEVRCQSSEDSRILQQYTMDYNGCASTFPLLNLYIPKSFLNHPNHFAPGPWLTKILNFHPRVKQIKQFEGGLGNHHILMEWRNVGKCGQWKLEQLGRYGMLARMHEGKDCLESL